MAGHSHWANIQRTKSAQDAKRGRLFSKWAKQIISAARQGGGDPDANLKLKYAIERAKADNMPKDSIARAVKKGTGELGGDSFEELIYEAFGPGGVAIVIESLTDNRKRTAPELRYILDRRGGNLGNSGSVLWMFDRKAVFAIAREGVDEDGLMEFALEHGADDVDTDQDAIFGITADSAAFLELNGALQESDYAVESAGVRYLPKNTVDVDMSTGKKLLDLIESLEENEDVQGVYSNAAYPDNMES